MDPNVVMGLDSKLFELGSAEPDHVHHHDEVETATVYRGTPPSHTHEACNGNCEHHIESTHADSAATTNDVIAENELTAALNALSKETVWRVKGFVRLERGYMILNWAFGRYELTAVTDVPERTGSAKLTVMGERGEVKRASRKLAERIGAHVV